MKIYLAASWVRMEFAREIAERLRSYGHVVTSRWLAADPSQYDTPGMDAHAQADIDDLLAAHAVVCITGDTGTRGGRHTEVGIAIATGRRVYLLGPREQVFHHHRLVTSHPEFDGLKLALEAA